MNTPAAKTEEQPAGRCRDCDPEIVDCLMCKAEGVRAQADYNAEHLPALDTASTDYDKTRVEYRDNRHLVALEVQDLRHQSKKLVERIKCMIKQEHVVECLDKAYEKVVRWLEKCSCAAGCCIDDDCEFDIDTEDLSDEDLAARTVDYQRRVDAAKACFATLVAEPAELLKRVAARKAEVNGIATDLGGDPAKTDPKELYARAKVARRRIGEIWLGFEHTSEFVDCLCLALMCWSRGVAAIALLKGEQAVRTCRADAAKKRCAYLAENTYKEVLATYDKICAHHDCHGDEAESSEE